MVNYGGGYRLGRCDSGSVTGPKRTVIETQKLREGR
jgi:hypothetical protein